MPNGELPPFPTILRKCSACKQLKPLDAFNKNRSMPKGRSYHCRVCIHNYYLANKDEIHKVNKRWIGSHPDKVKLIQKRDREKRKREVLTHYCDGALSYVHCGYSDIRALSIDHIDGGGSKHTRELVARGTSLYLWLKKQSYPEGYQVLCMNCQFIKKLEKGEVRSA